MATKKTRKITTFAPFDNTRAESEGWALFNQDDADCSIQRDDAAAANSPFERDDDAVAFVRYRAQRGSNYHKEALRLHEAAQISKSVPGAGMHVVLAGNLSEGFAAFGPFKTGDDALAWGQTQNVSEDEWWVMPLSSPDRE